MLVSDTSDFAANVEVCPAVDFEKQISTDQEKTLEKFPTPGQKTIDELSKFTGVSEKELVKTLFFSSNEGQDPKDKSLKAFAVLLRGSDEVNAIKVKNLLGMTNPPQLLTEAEVKEVSGALPGSCGPVGLKIPIYMDQGVQGLKNYIVGANEDDFHLKNINHGRDYQVAKVADLRLARAGDRCPESSGRLQAFRGIEVGHIFNLGKKYSQKMKATFLDKNGRAQPFEMGCYGIGVTRTVQAAIEQSHDADGIIWPASIAPFQVHLCVLDPKDVTVMATAEGLYKELNSMNIDVLMDDRDERPGIKFKDADLLGMPVRVVIGKRGLESSEVEVVERKTKIVNKIKPEQMIPEIKRILG